MLVLCVFVRMQWWSTHLRRISSFLRKKRWDRRGNLYLLIIM